MYRLPPRLTDWSLALATGVAAASGLVSLISGRTDLWLVFALHGAAGLWLLLLLWGKLRRVWPRIVHPRVWDRRTVLGLLAILIVALAIGSGIWWMVGGDAYLASFGLLAWHIIFGIALVGIVALHMVARAHRLRGRDVRGRRQAIAFGALVLGAAALWPAQQVLVRVLGLPGSQERFTGSRESGSFAGNDFPSSSWVADQPRPIDTDTWQLTVAGAVTSALTFNYNDLLTYGDSLDAVLDCTGGFYTEQHWHGARIGRILDKSGPLPEAGWVSFVSITSYRWSLPLEEAKNALLATHTDDEPLSHDHGAPVRLVAPGRRGFEWVKWITRIEVLTEPDYGEILAIHTSWLTPTGRGQ